MSSKTSVSLQHNEKMSPNKLINFTIQLILGYLLISTSNKLTLLKMIKQKRYLIPAGGHTCSHLSFLLRNDMDKLLNIIMKLILRNMSCLEHPTPLSKKDILKRYIPLN